MTLHFDGLNLMSHFFSQLSSAFRSSCNCILSLVLRISLYNKLSSAKRQTSDSVWLGMSLMYVKNNKGPGTVSCSTPDNTSVLSRTEKGHSIFFLKRALCVYNLTKRAHRKNRVGTM
jgi:hypothetical protein